jgi:nucleotide-binding universal stress UspA family protein
VKGDETVFERILLSVDGSDETDKAVRTTRELARLHGSEVVVVHGRDQPLVAPLAPSAPMPPRRLLTSLERDEEAGRLVDQTVAELRSSEVAARGRVLPKQGSVASQVLGAARSMRADLIVLSSRGMSQLWELMVGSAAHKIVRLAECPVLLVR